MRTGNCCTRDVQARKESKDLESGPGGKMDKRPLLLEGPQGPRRYEE